MLGARELRRLTLAHVAAFQQELIRQGRLARRAFIGRVLPPGNAEQADALDIDEATLGLDSLAVIDLVTRLNVFFGLHETGIEDHLLLDRNFGSWVRLLSQHLIRMGGEARLTFETSGSTGRPKRITHPRASLESEVEAILAGPFGEAPHPRRVLSAVPSHHIYGFLWGVLLPMRAGWPARDLPLGSPSALLREGRTGDLSIATPFTWNRLATVGQSLADDMTGISSGEPTSATTWLAVQSAGLSRFVEVYGSTETGGIGWRSRHDAPFELLPDIERRDGALTRPGIGVMSVQDRLQWAGSKAFSVVGRRDETVQVAGTNVDLARLRERLETDEDVKAAALRLDGERIKAFIATAAEDPEALERRLRTAAGALPAPARPDRYAFGPELPRTETGKLADW
jgi:4-coumarate--CoA ligase (photoactive yellow protein activation family)